MEYPELTTRVVGHVPQFDQRQQQHSRAAVGDLGPKVQERWTSEQADPFRRIYFPEVRPQNSPIRSWLPIADGPLNPKRAPVNDPSAMSQHIKDVARYFGADLVGVCELRPEHVYSHRGLRIDHHKGRWGEPVTVSHKFAISLGQEMEYHNLKYSPSFIDGAEVGKGYLMSALVAVQLACYIRELGYPAKAHFHIEEQVLHVPIALAAGLGELARNNCLITREFGPRLRLSTVTTDLPLAVDSPVDIGVQAFCGICDKCARYCPAQCLPRGPKTVERGYEHWLANNDKCIVYWNADRSKWNDCARCISVCPWNKPSRWWQRTAVRMVRYRLGRRFMLWLDDAVWTKKRLLQPKNHRWLHYTRHTSARKFENGQIYPPT